MDGLNCFVCFVFFVFFFVFVFFFHYARETLVILNPFFSGNEILVKKLFMEYGIYKVINTSNK